MRKLFTIIAVLFCAIAVMAGPNCGRGGHGGRGWHCGPRYYHHYRGGCYRGSDGVWLAAGITNIVANGLSIVRQVAEPVYTTPVYTTPVYQQPVVVPAPAVYTPPVCAPAPVYVGPRGYPQPIIETHRTIVHPYYPRTAPSVRYAPTVIYP